MTDKIKVVGMTATSTQAVLYLQNGSTKKLDCADYRTAEIVEFLTPRIARREVVELELTKFSTTAAIEGKTNGVVRFFRRLKSAVADVFGVVQAPEVYKPIDDARDLTPDETMVAVVNNVEIAGVEKIQNHLRHAAFKDARGFTLFMQRLAGVIENRGHSVDDILDFMEQSDLPLADDGSIIAYKRLKDVDDGWFVDYYTCKVRQCVGMVVQMSESMVDVNRNQECSNGLHIARRNYLSGFYNDGAVLLARIMPEDVIAVPHGDKSKVRVCRYELLAVLSKDAARALDQNRPMTEHAEAGKLLAMAIKGEFPPSQTTCTINGDMGQNLTYEGVDPYAGRKSEVVVKKIEEAKALDDDPEVVRKIDVRAIQKSVNEAALTGNMAAALNAPTVIEPKQPEKTAEAQQTVKSVGRGSTFPANESDLSASYQEALNAARAGKSKRQIELTIGVSSRTVGRLLGLYGK